jgi:hypothetical protein
MSKLACKDLFESTTVLVSSCLSAWSGCVHLLFCSYVRSRSIPSTMKIPSSKFQVPSSKFQVPSSKFQVPRAKSRRTKICSKHVLNYSYVRAHPHTLHLTPSWPDLLSDHPFCHLTQRAPTQHLQGTAGHVRSSYKPKKIQFQDSGNKCSVCGARANQPTPHANSGSSSQDLKAKTPWLWVGYWPLSTLCLICRCGPLGRLLAAFDNLFELSLQPTEVCHLDSKRVSKLCQVVVLLASRARCRLLVECFARARACANGHKRVSKRVL